MSDSDYSDAATPDDTTLENTLRRIVRDGLKKGDEITVNSVRTATEKYLGLATGFFKSTPAWKDRSKSIINAAVEQADEPSSPEKIKKSAPRSKPDAVKTGAKRKSSEPIQPKDKRRKKSVSIEEDEDEVGDDEDASDNVSDAINGPRKKAVRRKSAPTKAVKKVHSKDRINDSDSEEEDEEARADVTPQAAKARLKQRPPKKAVAGENSDGETKEEAAVDSVSSEAPVESIMKTEESTAAIDDDSDMSVLIDDAPPKKKRQKKVATLKAATKITEDKPTKAAAKELSPNEEEIKRLQSWLLKCGIRKLWHKELAPFISPKDKIHHLKAMLSEAGMGGRPSNEKARSIKEARELAAELEAAKEFEKQWGHEDNEGSGDDDEVEEEPRARGLVPKGLVDFGDSGEDSD